MGSDGLDGTETSSDLNAEGMRITFFGAAGTVTGSRYLVQTGSSKVLVDCGLFQGYKPLRERNWTPFPVPPREIDAVVLCAGRCLRDRRG